MVGISYRQLDYWVRQGIIGGGQNCCPGSGNRRHWTDEDVQRLRAIVAHYNEARGILEAFRTGELWRLAEHEAEAVA